MQQSEGLYSYAYIYPFLLSRFFHKENNLQNKIKKFLCSSSERHKLICGWAAVASGGNWIFIEVNDHLLWLSS